MDVSSKDCRARGFVTGYDALAVEEDDLRSVRVVEISSVPRSFVWSALNTRLDTCVYKAKASVQPVISSFLLRVYTTAGTSLVPVFRFLGVVSSAHLDTCVHEAGVRTDPAASLSLPRVYTTAELRPVPEFPVSKIRGFHTPLVSYVHVH